MLTSPVVCYKHLPKGSSWFLGRVTSKGSLKGWCDWHPDTTIVKPSPQMIMDLFLLIGKKKNKTCQGDRGSPLECQSEQYCSFLFLPGFLWMSSITWKGLKSLCKSSVFTLHSSTKWAFSFFSPPQPQWSPLACAEVAGRGEGGVWRFLLGWRVLFIPRD